MAEYIEREPILKFIEDGLNNPDKLKAFGHDAIEIMTEVQYAPAADVAPVVHARWVKDRDGDEYCENCFRYMPVREVTGDPSANDYCPNCGAKMEAKNDE